MPNANWPCLLSAGEQVAQGNKDGGASWGLGGGRVLDEVLRVDLVLLKNYKDSRVGHAVHAAVIESIALAFLGWRADKGSAAPDEVSHQHPGQEHGVGVCVRFAVVVRIGGISRKVAPFAIGCTVQTTDPPVKVLLADGVHEVGASPMKQLPLIYFLPPFCFCIWPFCHW